MHNSTLQYITIHNSTQQYITVHNSTQQYTAVHNNTQQYTTIHSSTQQYTTVHSSTQQYITVHNSAQQYTTVPNSTQQHSVAGSGWQTWLGRSVPHSRKESGRDKAALSLLVSMNMYTSCCTSTRRLPHMHCHALSPLFLFPVTWYCTVADSVVTLKKVLF